MPYLPKGVELDLFNGKTMVSLVGFMFKNTSLFHIPIPLFGTFEEINLRFYVKRTINGEVKSGVVFINETVPLKIVAWVANKLYREHYIAIPTKSNIQSNTDTKQIRYEWDQANKWSHLSATASNISEAMTAGSIEEFIFEHYYGYTKLSTNESQEYKVNHPRWNINKVLDYSIDCDFSAMYGKDFSFLNHSAPHSVILAKGSEVTVDWQRTKF